jgi:hypothetical protein
MKCSNIYLVKTVSSKTGEGEVPHDIQDKILNEISDVLDPGDMDNVVSEEYDDSEYMFFRLSKMKVMRICSILEPYVNFDLVEVGENIIKGETKDFDFIVSNTQFKSFFDNYRLDVADVDDILDKINNKGIENIDEIDKIILSK